MENGEKREEEFKLMNSCAQKKQINKNSENCKKKKRNMRATVLFSSAMMHVLYETEKKKKVLLFLFC